MNFTFNQVKMVLYNYTELSSGIYPAQMLSRFDNVGIRVPPIGRASFESACLLAAEIGLRVKRCGIDGMIVEAVFMRGRLNTESSIAREYHIDQYDVHRRINRVCSYCEGNDIKSETYEEWRQKNRFKKNVRNTQNIAQNVQRVLTKHA